MKRILSIAFCAALAASGALSAAVGSVPQATVSIDDVVLLAGSDISDQTIFTYLDFHKPDFVLDPDTLLRLRDSGVSEAVIRYLLEIEGTSSNPAATGLATPGTAAADTALIGAIPPDYRTNGYPEYYYGSGGYGYGYDSGRYGYDSGSYGYDRGRYGYGLGSYGYGLGGYGLGDYGSFGYPIGYYDHHYSGARHAPTDDYGPHYSGGRGQGATGRRGAGIGHATGSADGRARASHGTSAGRHRNSSTHGIRQGVPNLSRGAGRGRSHSGRSIGIGSSTHVGGRGGAHVGGRSGGHGGGHARSH